MIRLRKPPAGRRSRRTLLPALLFFVGAAASTLGASPAEAQETRRVAGLAFSRVLLLGGAELEISQGDTHELLLRGDARDLDDEPFYVRGDSLFLGRSRRNRAASYDDLQFRVGMPVFQELRVTGSGEAYVREFVQNTSDSGEPVRISVEGSGDIRVFAIEAPAVRLRVEGSGELRAVRVVADSIAAVVSGSGDLYIGEVRADEGEFVVTGSGDLEVTESGYVRDLEVSVVGSGDARLDNVASDVAETNIVGSGTATIGVCAERLEASLLGSGDVRYGGNPQVEATSFGSGEVRPRN